MLKELNSTGKLFARSYREHCQCARYVLDASRPFLVSPSGTPRGYGVCPEAPSFGALSIRKNLFSTLFYSTYLMLDISHSRRMLYGKLNYLFRIWVTSADNLLDNEDKAVLPMRIPGDARVMKQVISIMAADRVMNEILGEAVMSKTVTHEMAEELSRESLRILLPSAAQEATEEGGIKVRPGHEYVLNTIHRLKTGMLFQIPLLGPRICEDQSLNGRITAIENGLMSFGLGCQLLDDIRDVARDHKEMRHNYLLSYIFHEDDMYRELLSSASLDSRVYMQMPSVALKTADRAVRLLTAGLDMLADSGLDINRKRTNDMALSMFKVLDLRDLLDAYIRV